jgi:hypothetical protein
MSGASDRPSQGKALSIPGQPTEEAIAEVGSEAAKSVLRGLGRLGNAAVSEWAAKREARAEAARIAIETDVRVKTDATFATARREQEITELDHHAALERRAARLRIELAREQLNLEAIERRAIEFADGDPKNGNARELNEDWVFSFADLAQKVSDKDVQALWARVLSSAAIEDAPTLSAAALQTLSLFEAGIAESFKRFVAAISKLGLFPYVPDGEKEPQQIDLGRLFDLGLVSEQIHNAPVKFDGFSFGEERTTNLGFPVPQSHIGLTRRGYDIATAVFREDLPLSEANEQQYLQWLLRQQLRTKNPLTINTQLERTDLAVKIQVTKKNNPTGEVDKVDWKSSCHFDSLNKRLRKMLLSIEQDYHVEIK